MDGWLKCNFDGAWEEHDCVGGVGVGIQNETETFVAAMTLKMVGFHGRCRLRWKQFPKKKRKKKRDGSSENSGDVCTGRVYKVGGIWRWCATGPCCVKFGGSGVDDTSPLGHVVNDARYFLRTIPHIKLTCTRWEAQANKVAHRLARLWLSLEQQLVWLEKSPNVITDLMARDTTSL